ncbi:DUF5050 domain-containing protein [Brevibacillus sp. HB1.3]|uniref:DUF5050 domain-containing protein n=1 Tax=Brevibacillus sp. HB1.3 TaxID=2738842 RepID=UPI00155801A6|nr:DUF5050 domain-containing protein [Brevibacillus sp. HB1.3]NQF16333.1 DUF5050 domain-containing protein [Brevibacillus sp. HB1.3]
MKRKSIASLIVSITIFLLFTLYGCTTSTSESSSLGSYASPGSVATQGDWIYYNDNGLYKMKQDGSSLQKLSSDWADDITVAGDWIYYTRNRPYESLYKLELDTYDINDTYEDTYELIKIKTDGSSKTIVKSADMALLNSNVEDPNNVYASYVIDDTIYYQSSWAALYRMDVDGGNEKRLLDYVGGLYFYQDWIIYTTDNVGQLYKMKRDGTQNTLISEEELEVIGVSNDFIYFTKWVNENGVVDVFKIGLNDSKASLVKQGFLGTEGMIVSGSFMYYLSNSSDMITLERMNLEDGQITKLHPFSGYSSLKMSGDQDYLFLYGFKNFDDSTQQIFKLKWGDTKVEKIGPKKQ